MKNRRSEAKLNGAIIRRGATATLAAALLLGTVAVPAAGAESSAQATSVAAPVDNAGGGSIDATSVKVTEEQAKQRINELFPILKQAEASDVRLTRENGMDEEGPSVWQINFTIRTGPNSSSGFNASVDAMTGDLRQLNLPYELTRSAATYPPKLNREQAKEVALRFLAKALPSQTSQTWTDLEGKGAFDQVTPLIGPTMYSFSLQRKFDGIKVQGQMIQIGVDGSGNVTSFYSSNPAKELPSSKPTISLADAKKQWEQDLNLQLVYTSADWKDEPALDSWKLIYLPILNPAILDAQSGKWIGYTGEAVSAKVPSYVKLENSSSPFVPKKMTAEEAARAVEAYVEIPSDYKLTSRSVQPGRDGGHAIIDLRWQKADSPFQSRAARVDAETGELLSFSVDFYDPRSSGNDSTKEVPALPYEQAAKLADEWMGANVVGASDYRRTVSDDGGVSKINQNGYTTVTYMLFYRDLPVQSRTMSVTLNAEGKLAGFYGRGALSEAAKNKLASLQAVITPEKAKKTFAEAVGWELQYAEFGGFYTLPGNQYTKRTAKLVYTQTDANTKEPWSRMLDATTGKFVAGYSPNIPVVPTTVPADVEKHWAASQLNALLQHGVIKPDDKGLVHPDRVVSVGDFIRMLALAISPYFGTYESSSAGSDTPWFADVPSSSPYYSAVGFMVGRHWLKSDPGSKLKPEAPLTRDALADLLSRVVGYEKLAPKLSDDPALARLRDAGKIAHPGAAALALKLGLLTASNGEFSPADEVPLAHAAVVLVRLAERQADFDRPLAE